mgnify:CR=1 FL=1
MSTRKPLLGVVLTLALGAGPAVAQQTPGLGKPITDYIRRKQGENAAEKEDIRRQTEYSQPATLTVDIAP